MLESGAFASVAADGNTKFILTLAGPEDGRFAVVDTPLVAGADDGAITDTDATLCAQSGALSSPSYLNACADLLFVDVLGVQRRGGRYGRRVRSSEAAESEMPPNKGLVVEGIGSLLGDLNVAGSFIVDDQPL